ncbi:hypothetical protein [Sulfurirhabdus autotrophica]|uniref:Uncharacterized protein n=1 Tax=Sulfurirhabdus autotrophica TaxID=1706046 RepID=A0A4R3XXD5_9PROT|nr:hypothetical protein [Sulfurirhabdus autotrophica]TCV82928.1 hypothetical protein EDC63_11857 [Sulfurirhabdus autotrophica]
MKFSPTSLLNPALFSFAVLTDRAQNQICDRPKSTVKSKSEEIFIGRQTHTEISQEYHTDTLATISGLEIELVAACIGSTHYALFVPELGRQAGQTLNIVQ